MRTLLPLLVIAAAGCDKAVEMTFTAPVAGGDIDTGCVNAIEVMISGDDNELYTCIEVAEGHVESLSRHNLAGLFEQPLPPWPITGIQVRGASAPGGCTGDFAIGPTIFVASTANATSDQVFLEMRGVLSCTDRVAMPTPVRVVDFEALIADGSCVAVEGVSLAAGDMFRSAVYENEFSQGWQMWYWETAEVLTDAGGLATMPYTFGRAQTGSCVAAELFDGNEFWPACFTPAGRGACGNEPELYYLPFRSVANASLTAEEAVLRSIVVFGVVLDDARQPIPGATIRITDPDIDAVVHYTNPNVGGVGFAAADGGASTTTAAGTFTVLANQPVLLEVTAPGKVTRYVMASGYGATIVAMDPG